MSATKCVACGNELSESQNKVCSHSCAGKLSSDARETKPKVTKTCEWCAKDFKVDQHREDTARFCSPECVGLSVGAKREKTRVTLQCEYCSEDYEARPSRADESKYCSRSCSAKDYWENYSPPERRTCIKCGYEGPSEDFPKGNQCTDCLTNYKRQWYERQKEKGVTVDWQECSQCGQFLPASCFTKFSGSKSGLNSRCQRCYRRRKRWRYHLDPNVRERMKKYEKKNPGKIKEWAKNSYERKKDDPEFKRKRRVEAMERIARKQNAPGEYDSEDIEALWERQSGQCMYCKSSLGDDASDEEYQVDHIIALASGGTNRIQNLQLLCCDCNRSKGAQNPNEYAKEHGLLMTPKPGEHKSSVREEEVTSDE